MLSHVNRGLSKEKKGRNYQEVLNLVQRDSGQTGMAAELNWQQACLKTGETGFVPHAGSPGSPAVQSKSCYHCYAVSALQIIPRTDCVFVC